MTHNKASHADEAHALCEEGKMLEKDLSHVETSIDELWGISTFFNPANYQNKRTNFVAFATRARRQGLKLLVVELLFGDQAPSLPSDIGDTHLLLRSDSVLWQKERLLNLAFESLPPTCTQVAWLDGDLLFTSANWIADAKRALKITPVIQLFESVWFLPPPASGAHCSAQASGWVADAGRHRMTSAGKALESGERERILRGQRHPGLAWAATRELLTEVGFYDKLILGGADTVTTFALCGLHEDEDVRATFRNWWSPQQFEDVMAWAARLHAAGRGTIGYIPGIVYHLWHGNRTNRAYGKRQFLLKEFDFDPASDIKLDENGLWTWATDKRELHEGVRNYFHERREDQAPASDETAIAT